jgi:hypothetical protein
MWMLELACNGEDEVELSANYAKNCDGSGGPEGCRKTRLSTNYVKDLMKWDLG